LYPYRFMYSIINYRKGNKVKMIESSNTYPQLVWTINALRADGKTEVIKVCKNCCDADEAIQNDPNKYYKSGPIPLS